MRLIYFFISYAFNVAGSKGGEESLSSRFTKEGRELNIFCIGVSYHGMHTYHTLRMVIGDFIMIRQESASTTASAPQVTVCALRGVSGC